MSIDEYFEKFIASYGFFCWQTIFSADTIFDEFNDWMPALFADFQPEIFIK
jgi:hypothetical protein